MVIQISPERQAFIDREVSRGAGTASEIADRALKLYEQQLEQLRTEIASADAEVEAGRGTPFNPDAFRKAQDVRLADRIANAKN